MNNQITNIEIEINRIQMMIQKIASETIDFDVKDMLGR